VYEFTKLKIFRSFQFNLAFSKKCSLLDGSSNLCMDLRISLSNIYQFEDNSDFRRFLYTKSSCSFKELNRGSSTCLPLNPIYRSMCTCKGGFPFINSTIILMYSGRVGLSGNSSINWFPKCINWNMLSQTHRKVALNASKGDVPWFILISIKLSFSFCACSFFN